jgi:hypothetical protein
MTALGEWIFFRELGLKGLHSTARKGATIRANQFRRKTRKGSDARMFEHVTLL